MNEVPSTFSTTVSIPQGTIKSKSLELREVKDKPVSIPQGTIKSLYPSRQAFASDRFQFHKVRLKDNSACYHSA